MLSVLDEDKDVNYVLWDGSSLGHARTSRRSTPDRSMLSRSFSSGNQDRNDRPVLSDTSVTLNAVVEDAGPPVGGRRHIDLGHCRSESARGRPRQRDRRRQWAVTGVAITAADTTNGSVALLDQWWYHLESTGRRQRRFGPPVGGRRQHANLLPAECRLQRHHRQCLHLPRWDQTDDNTNGTAGVDTTTNGGQRRTRSQTTSHRSPSLPSTIHRLWPPILA